MRVAAAEEGEDGRRLRGRDGASGSGDGEGEFDPGAPPPFGLAEIRAAIPKHCWVKDPWRSAGYVVRDVAVVLGLAAAAAHLDSWAVWPLYWVAQGTMFWALFVLGHDWYTPYIPSLSSNSISASALACFSGRTWSSGS